MLCKFCSHLLTLLATGISRQLDAINGEHLASDQTLMVANDENLSKQFGNLLPPVGDEGSKRGEVRLAVAGDGDEQVVLPTGLFYLAAAADATAIGQQNDFDEHCRVKGAGAFGIILIAAVEGSEV